MAKLADSTSFVALEWNIAISIQKIHLRWFICDDLVHRVNIWWTLVQ